MVPVEAIIEYEQGTLDGEGTLRLFAELVRTGMAWSLQGHYGRTAASLVRAGFLSPGGAVTDKGRDAVGDTAGDVDEGTPAGA